MKKVFHQKTINHRSNTLMVLDVLMATMLGMVAFFVVSKNSLTMPVYDHAWWLMPLSTALLLNITNLSVGLYDVKLRDSNIGLYRRCLVSGAMTFCIFEILVFNAFQKLEIAPIAFALFLLATVSVIFISRFMANTFEMFGITKKRVIVIGSGERASIIEKRMRREADRRGFKLVGFIKLNTDKEDQLRNENILEIGSLDNLQAYVAENRIDEIVIAPDERRGSLPLESLFDCKMTGVVVKDILDFIEEETGQVAVNLIYPSWVIYSNGFQSRHYIRVALDYTLNVVLAVLVFLFTWPIILVTSLLIYIEDGHKKGGTIFYKQTRVGMDGNLFEIIKFRSMRQDAEKDGAQWATKSDNRVTKIGAALRKYRIDELPQLFNVFKGEMDFVGPRPERPEFVKELIKEIPYYNHRHNVKPGLTGWAQLNYPYGSSVNDSLEKLKFDLYYIKRRSILLDLLILVRTIEIILFGKGR
ncbi:TIGR03013 family PEP-CTERM/XrtA system glycosyltransferase [Psychrosphaera sp. 1_MG-2023]|nr:MULTISPECIES: TIGR03013 family XrtA/PEP-CTERM system glycosyltransferase [unclassified Psychrosphaera]MDO6720363.1 TIGR03013 family PEP-CTERM/XrtA system glycosyltransferase [Psychrosphaera sp. 1_MG-2023]